MLLTRAQREALKRVWDRLQVADVQPAPSYRQFRRSVRGTFCSDNCVMVPFAGMWLGIERDGYTHS